MTELGFNSFILETLGMMSVKNLDISKISLDEDRFDLIILSMTNYFINNIEF